MRYHKLAVIISTAFYLSYCGSDDDGATLENEISNLREATIENITYELIRLALGDSNKDVKFVENADGYVIKVNGDSLGLTGTIPKELGKLSQLQELSLSNNQLTGTIPKELGNLSQLQELNLSNNQLEGTIPTSLIELRLITGLYLNNNQLTGSIPSIFGEMSQQNLTHLYLNENKLTGSIPSIFGEMSQLRRLYLYGNTGLDSCSTALQDSLKIKD